MHPTYWKERCDAAEAALRKARSGIRVTDLRGRILAALGELRPNDWLDTRQAAALLQVDEKHARAVLCTLDELGLVEQTPGRRGINGMPARWRLGYLVQVAEAAE